jgi:cell division transport system permease protein
LLMTSAAVITVAISLTLVAGAFLVRQGVSNATVQWKDGVELSIFMQPDATEDQLDAVRRQLSTTPSIKKITYVSKPEAYEEFKRLFRNNPDLVETVTADRLPPSFRVVPEKAEQIETIGAPFRDRPGVFRVVYADQIKSLLNATRALQIGFLIIAILLLLSASALILNSIRMAIYARRREVAVMKLVGATNWFIRVPFMCEGLLQGVAGAICAFLVVVLGRNLAQNRVVGTIFEQMYVSATQVLGTGLFIVFIGAVVGAAGSALAVRRFLDV